MALADDDRPPGAPMPAPKPTPSGGSLPKANLGDDEPTKSGSGSGSSVKVGSSSGSRRSALRALQRYFVNLGLGSGLANWAYGLMRKGWSMDGILAELYRRPEFKKAYPGIFRKDGSLIVSPQEYRQLTEAYQSVAAQYGLTLSKDRLAKLVQGENSIEEAQLKLKGVQTIQANPDLLNVLKRIAPQSIKNAGDAYNFVLGRADQVVYDIYEAAAIKTQFERAGVVNDMERAKQLARQTEGVVDFADISQRVAELKKQIDFAGPELLAFGASQRDLEDMQFGKPNPAVVARVERAVKQREASFKAKGQQQMGRGVRGRPVVAGSPQEAGF